MVVYKAEGESLVYSSWLMMHYIFCTDKGIFNPCDMPSNVFLKK